VERARQKRAPILENLSETTMNSWKKRALLLLSLIAIAAGGAAGSSGQWYAVCSDYHFGTTGGWWGPPRNSEASAQADADVHKSQFKGHEPTTAYQN
jgi:hypothetical protein